MRGAQQVSLRAGIASLSLVALSDAESCSLFAGQVRGGGDRAPSSEMSPRRSALLSELAASTATRRQALFSEAKSDLLGSGQRRKLPATELYA